MTSHSYDYDLFVIGAGSGGVRAARIAASHGAKVAIAEEAKLGGTCVNVGCVPKKLFAYASDFHAHIEDAKNYGWDAQSAQHDWSTLIKNKNNEINRLNGIYNSLLEKFGVKLFNGRASFIDDHTVQINNQKVSAERILIAVGGRPRPLPSSIKGGEHAIISDDAFYLDDLPDHITIYGGGYIAVEFAHIFSGLGRSVSLIYRGELVLRGFDTEISKHLMDEMTKQGVDIRCETEITSITPNDNGYKLELTNGELETGLVLAAIGRDSYTKGLGLENAGVHTNKAGYVDVDQNFATNIPNIYAVGDINGQAALTPVAIAEGHWLADTLYGNIDRPAPDKSNIPTAVFSRPPIGTVGLSEEDARKQGFDIKIYKSTFRPMKNTISGRDEKTLMKLIVDTKTDKILGLHMIGEDTPEILQGFAVAIQMGAKKADFDRTIAIHPTAAEELVTMR